MGMNKTERKHLYETTPLDKQKWCHVCGLFYIGKRCPDKNNHAKITRPWDFDESKNLSVYDFLTESDLNGA